MKVLAETKWLKQNMLSKELTYLVILNVFVKILQPQYITKSVVSFLSTKRVKGGFARCFLCRMDLQTTSGGFRSLHEQWKSTEQQLREIEYPLQHGKLLLNGNCKKTSRKERERQKAPVVGLTLVHLETTLSLAQVLDNEDELE